MPRVPPASAEVERVPNARKQIMCPHCGKKKSRWTVWRHLNEKNHNAALNARISVPSFYPRLTKRNLHLPSRTHPLPPSRDHHPPTPPPPASPHPSPLSPPLAPAPLNDDGAWIDDPSAQLDLDLDRPPHHESQDVMDVDQPVPSTPPPHTPSPLGSPGSLDDDEERRSLNSASTGHSSGPSSPSWSPRPRPHNISDEDDDEEEDEVIVQPQGPRTQTYSTRLPPPPPRLTNDLQKLRAARLSKYHHITISNSN